MFFCDGFVAVTAQSEVDRYLQLPQSPHVTDDGRDTDILLWWRDKSWEFPHLSKMARQFLALPCSSAGKLLLLIEFNVLNLHWSL